MALEVPHNINEQQKVTLIATFPNHYTDWRKLTLFDAVDYQSATSGRCFVNFLRFLWDPLSGEGPTSARISKHEFDISPNALPSEFHFSTAHSFHGTIGRLVLASRGQGLLYVYDLVPVGSSKAIGDDTG